MFGRRDYLIKIGRKRIEENRGRYVEHIYEEHEAGGTSWLDLSNVPFEDVGFNTETPHEPILDSVKNFLADNYPVWTLLCGLSIHSLSSAQLPLR